MSIVSFYSIITLAGSFVEKRISASTSSSKGGCATQKMSHLTKENAKHKRREYIFNIQEDDSVSQKESIRFRSRVSSSECQHVIQYNVKQTSMHYILSTNNCFSTCHHFLLFLKTIHEAPLYLKFSWRMIIIPSDFCLLGGYSHK